MKIENIHVSDFRPFGFLFHEKGKVNTLLPILYRVIYQWTSEINLLFDRIELIISNQLLSRSLFFFDNFLGLPEVAPPRLYRILFFDYYEINILNFSILKISKVLFTVQYIYYVQYIYIYTKVVACSGVAWFSADRRRIFQSRTIKAA